MIALTCHVLTNLVRVFKGKIVTEENDLKGTGNGL